MTCRAMHVNDAVMRADPLDDHSCPSEIVRSRTIERREAQIFGVFCVNTGKLGREVHDERRANRELAGAKWAPTEEELRSNLMMRAFAAES